MPYRSNRCLATHVSNSRSVVIFLDLNKKWTTPYSTRTAFIFENTLEQLNNFNVECCTVNWHEVSSVTRGDGVVTERLANILCDVD